MKVTVNIAVKDRRAMLAACLDGLGAQAFRDFDVVVVDNGSSDGSDDEARVPRGFALKVVTELGSLGAVRNAGVQASDGELVAFVDSDCVPTAEWLANGVAAFSADPSRTTVQGKTLPDPSAARGRWDATQEITAFTHRYEACNLFYRRDALERAGGFDETIGFFGEDSAAGWAVRRLGGAEHFAPFAIVHHAVAYPGLRWHLRRCLRYGNWNRLVRRFPEMRQQFFLRWFLRPASAQTLLFMLGTVLLVAGAVRHLVLAQAGAVTAMLPFLWRHRLLRWAWSRTGIIDTVGGMVFDLTIEAALLWGSIRERTLVL